MPSFSANSRDDHLARAAKTDALFSTQKAAVARGRSIVRKRASGQIVIHGKSGRITTSEVHGLPKIQKSPVKSSLGSKNIERGGRPRPRAARPCLKTVCAESQPPQSLFHQLPFYETYKLCLRAELRNPGARM